MGYQSAILGCGPRARSHARAYAELRRARLAAVCDLDSARAEALATAAGATSYHDPERMLSAVRPDILHIVTQPALRVALLRLAADASVPLVVVEKPIALTPADATAIGEIGARSKVVVNHQLRFFDCHRRIAETVAAGQLGDWVHLRAACRGNLAQQGTHMMDLLMMLTGDRPPIRVYGAVYRGPFDPTHPAPAMAGGTIEFESGVRAQIEAGEHAPPARGETNHWLHCHIAAIGTRGQAWASLGQGWEITAPDCRAGGDSNWDRDDLQGQTRLVEACCDWLDDDTQPHPARLESALMGLNALFGLELSGLERRPVDLPCDAPPDLLERLRAELATGEPGPR